MSFDNTINIPLEYPICSCYTQNENCAFDYAWGFAKDNSLFVSCKKCEVQLLVKVEQLRARITVKTYKKPEVKTASNTSSPEDMKNVFSLEAFKEKKKKK